MYAKPFKFFITILFLAFLSGAHAQEEAKSRRTEPKGQFSGLMRLGVNTSQIYGDDFGGYHKVGFTAGVGTTAKLTNHGRFQIELNYATRGSRKRPTDKDPTTYRISPHYIDIPILYVIPARFFEIEFGLCNGVYLFHTESDNIGRIPDALESWQFNRYELAANGGFNVPIGQSKWLVNGRFHYSILPALGRIGTIGNGFGIYGGAYNNVITLSLHRLFLPS